jgi:hypothetical protein
MELTDTHDLYWFLVQHTVFGGMDGNYGCSCCIGAHKENLHKAAGERGKPDLSGRKMARGDEWRYSENHQKPLASNMVRSTRMVSQEAPEFITRAAAAVPSRDFGHQHPFADGSHTARLRDASVQKGCGRKCAWLRTAESKETPFNDPNRPKRPTGRARPKSAPVIRPPYAVSKIQHSNEFNKSSTKHQIGKQATNRFYNSIGGWSAARN